MLVSSTVRDIRNSMVKRCEPGSTMSAKSRLDEEAGFKPLGMGISLPLQQLECLLLVVVLVDDLLDHRQDPDAEAAAWDCVGVERHVVPRRRATPRASRPSRECLLDLLLCSSYHGACKRLARAIPEGN